MSKALAAHHVAFPGFSEAFFANWSAKPARTLTEVDESDLRRRMSISNRHEAIKAAVDVFVEQLVALHVSATKIRPASGTS
jgi:hypothetical protein